MKDILDILLSDRPLSHEERLSVRQAIEEDPALREYLEKWCRLEDATSSRIEEILPDRRLLVLSVMQKSGVTLSEDELAFLRRNEQRLGMFESTISSGYSIKDRVEADCAAFDRAWAKQFETGPDRRHERPLARRDVPARSRWLWRIPVAATVIFFIALTILLVRRDAAFEEIATGPNETRLVELAGGTLIHLRESSHLSYIPKDAETLFHNRARLSGRALIEVAPTQAGFTLETPTANVTVIGTVFAVDSDDAATDLYVVEGRVTFAPEANPRDAVTLDAGHHSRVERNERPSQPRIVDLASALEWTGFFVFRSTPMHDIASRLGRHYSVEIEIDDVLRDETVTGTFDASQPVATILQTIAAAVNASIEDVPSGYRIMAQ
jgi:ferric-dicitrate binding protein FerR (iron transport regulator)